MSVQVYSLLGQTERERKTFFGRVQGRGPQREINLKSNWLLKKSVKFEIIPPLLCYLLDSLTNKYGRVWSFVIHFVDIF